MGIVLEGTSSRGGGGGTMSNPLSRPLSGDALIVAIIAIASN